MKIISICRELNTDQKYMSLRKWSAFRATVGGVDGVLAWMAWVAFLRGWRASLCSVGGVGGVLTWVPCYYYCYCYYWYTTLKKKVLSVNFYKNEKMFEIDLNSDLKIEPNLKSRYCFTLLRIDLNPNVGKYASICVTLWICLNISET